ncbi:YggU family protein [bacterium]|nr:YggU family protein [bacterium]
MAPWLKEDESGIVTMKVRVQPGASRNEISSEPDGGIKLRITARAVDGGANQELIKFLSKTLKVSKSSIEITRGAKARTKWIAIKTLSADDISQAISRSIEWKR